MPDDTSLSTEQIATYLRVQLADLDTQILAARVAIALNLRNKEADRPALAAGLSKLLQARADFMEEFGPILQTVQSDDTVLSLLRKDD